MHTRSAIRQALRRRQVTAAAMDEFTKTCPMAVQQAVETFCLVRIQARTTRMITHPARITVITRTIHQVVSGKHTARESDFEAVEASITNRCLELATRIAQEEESVTTSRVAPTTRLAHRRALAATTKIGMIAVEALAATMLSIMVEEVAPNSQAPTIRAEAGATKRIRLQATQIRTRSQLHRQERPQTTTTSTKSCLSTIETSISQLKTCPSFSL